MPAMIARRFVQRAPKACETFLPFLYQTKTIQRQGTRQLSGSSTAAPADSAQGQPAEDQPADEQKSTVYKPNTEARWTDEHGAPIVVAGDRGTDENASRERSSGRKRVLYPSLMLPHQRTEAARRERAQQSDELDNTVASNTRPHSPGNYGKPEGFTTFTARRREKAPDAIPFDKGNAHSVVPDATVSTITPAERRVFERLFKASTTSTIPSKDSATTIESSSAGKITETAKRAATSVERPAPQFPAVLQPMAKAAQLRVRTPRPPPEQIPRNADGVPESFSALHAQGRISSSISKERKRLEAAKTDYECWRILTSQLDKYLAMLSPPDPADQQYMARLVAEILPAVLVSGTNILRNRFPGSNLALGVLPALKHTGQQAFAIGCSTALYNAHMSILYHQYSDISAIVDMLQEMDEKVYPFDDETHAILDKILYDARGVRQGILENLSPAMMLLWSTERIQRAVRDVEKWKDIVEERRQNEALRLARQKDDLLDVVEKEGAYDWMLKEGEYLKFKRQDGIAAEIGGGTAVQPRTRRRNEEIQEKVDALMPEGRKGRDEKRKFKTAKAKKTTNTRAKTSAKTRPDAKQGKNSKPAEAHLETSDTSNVAVRNIES